MVVSEKSIDDFIIIGAFFCVLNFHLLIIYHNSDVIYREKRVMELYLFLALIMLYILMAIFVKKNVQRKIWTLAFVVSFIITAVSIGFLHVNNQDVMMSADQLNWYYLLYLFGSLSVVIGVINLWMYRSGLIQIFLTGSDDDDDSDDDKK